MPYVDCHTCKNSKCQRSNGSIGYSFCDRHVPVQPTNADRIRGMSDEELAEMIMNWQKADPSVNWCRDEYGCAGLGEDFVCMDELQAGCIMRWLRQSAEEANDGQTI